MTRRLIEVESIGSDELKEIVEQSAPGPQVVPGTSETRHRPTGSDATDSSSNSQTEKHG
jgi:hypothetical protein